MKLHEKIKNVRYSTLLFPIIGTVIQIIFWIVLFLFGVDVHKDPFWHEVIGILAFIWFFVPLLSIYGMCISYKQIIVKKTLFPIMGMMFNIVWFLIFSYIAFLAFFGYLTT